jgi:valyl-tRNA synthetase
VIVDEFGADAFRFTLVAFAAMGRDVRLSEDRIAGYRNFVNKLWNASRFAAMKREGVATSCEMPHDLRLVPNRWIRSRLAAAIAETREALDSYRFNEAAQALYRFTWNEFCDWYIEISKVLLDGDDESRAETLLTLTATLEQLLRLLHPLVPFVTEELWQELPVGGRAEGMLITGSYPEAHVEWRDASVDAAMDTLIEVVRSVRNIRAEMRIAPRVELELWLEDGANAAVVRDNEAMVRRLARLGSVTYGGSMPAGAATAVVAGSEIAVPIAAHVDLVAETERLRREIERAASEVARAAGKLANESFVARAKEEVVEAERAKLAAAEQEKTALQAAIARIESIGAAS